MPGIWVSAGSNVDREANIRKAVEMLRASFGKLVLSPVYQTRAIGFDGEDFFNLVLGFDSELNPGEIRNVLRTIEEQCGRIRGGDKFTPRTLDLDLLTWGDLVDAEIRGGLPRGEILDYLFVLQPLADVAPDEKHPVTGERYADILAQLGAGMDHALKRIDLDLE